MMKRPSPPNETIAPIVAVAMTWRVAVRSPPMTIGDAIGSSTRRRIPPSVMPIPRLASTRSRSTERRPA